MIRRLAFFLWLIPLAVGAQTDGAGRAAKIAWGIISGGGSALKTRPVQESVIPLGNPAHPLVFVVTYKPAGFVIVAPDASGSPLLGYSLTSSFPADPGHPLRSWLLPSYSIAAYGQAKLKSGSGIQLATDQIVMPLVSAQWGQGSTWNRYCPADSSGKKALAGCVAVAMAQIMEKWRWPSKGYGEVSYLPLLHPEYGTIAANFDTTSYRWDLTNDLYPTDAAALILFHAGAATYMTYDPVFSSTSVDHFAVPALIGNFSYNPGMVFRNMDGSSFTEWIRMLHQELDNDRPVLYAGTSPDGRSSHAFNIDGYRNDTWFHFNWGWDGAGDGWYTLDHMAGGGADFSSGQGAIFGIQPANLPLHDRPSSLDILAGDGFVQLYWEKPVMADFSNFNIYRDGVRIGQTGDPKFRDQGLVNGHTYTYRITAWYEGQKAGESESVPEVTAVPWTRLEPGYQQTFETGAQGWQMLNSDTGFRIGTAESLHVGGITGNIAAIRSEGHPAGQQVADYLTSPIIYPGNYAHLAVSFDYMFRQNPGTDQLLLMWRDYTTGTWQPVTGLDSTGSYSDWRNVHFYLPKPAGNHPIQIAFYYNDFFGQGYGAAIDNFTLYEVAEPAVPKVSASMADLCLTQTVTYTDESTGTINSWEWDFGEGAQPRFANTPGPHVVSYLTSGKKTVRLSLNHLDHLLIPEAVSIRDQPVAAFEFYRRDQTIFFVNKALHAEQLLWQFGDGATSDQGDPLHTYITKDKFKVSQIAYNGTCNPDTLTQFIDLRSANGIGDNDALSKLTIYPNPTNGKVTLLWNILPENEIKIRLMSITGQTFTERIYPPQMSIDLNISDFPNGIYILQITSGMQIRNEHIVKINN